MFKEFFTIYKPQILLWLQFLLVIFSIFCPIALMNIHLFGSIRFLYAFSTALLISLPFIFLPPKWRPLSLIPVWLIVIFYLTNLWYWRFFSDFIPFSNYFMFGNFDADLFGAGASLVKFKDFAMAFPAILLTLCYIFKIFKDTKSLRFIYTAKYFITSLTLFCFFSNELICVYQDKDFRKNNGVFFSLQNRYNPQIMEYSNLAEFKRYSFIPYILRSITRPVCQKFKIKDLTSEELVKIDQFANIHHRLSRCMSDSDAFLVNRNKNLIFIVVESLNSWVMDLEFEGKKIMPFLSSLMKSEGSISNFNSTSQVHSGNSSDGQFIYNTGLHAASDVTTVANYLDNDLPTLAKKLNNHYSFEVICESPSMWKHSESNKSYGFQNFFYNTDRLAKKENLGRDEAMFKTALEVIDTVAKPFYGMLITMSMHAAFDDRDRSDAKWIKTIPGMSETMKDYLMTCNYFDSELGKFLDLLKQKRLYDSTIITIASDHTTPIIGDKHNAQYTDIVFCLLNSGITYHSEFPMGQVDVFPTILHVMGRYNINEYTGMGLSILNPSLTGAIDKFGNIKGQNISAQLDSLLRLSTETANLMHRANKYPNWN